MQLLNLFKLALLWLADFINWAYDPFEEFTRPEEVKYYETLEEKATKFEADMWNFFEPSRGLFLYSQPQNSGDQCLWHGVYTALWAIKFSVTATELDLERLVTCARGLISHQSPTGEFSPRLIRGWRADGTYEDNVSNDQASGHVLGIYFLWKYGNIECREIARRLSVGLAEEIRNHNNQLMNADGTVTQFGKLENGYLTDPLNLTLDLAIYRLAYELSDDHKYLDSYDELVSKYRLLIPYANLKLLWWKQDSSCLRAAIHYTILCDLENDWKLHDKYVAGMLRTWKMDRKGCNPYIYYLMRRVINAYPEYEERVQKHLKEFTLEDKQYNVEKVNSDKVESFNWGGHRRARQPLPRWKVGSQDFFWQRNMHSVDDWIGNKVGDTRHNGGDFLAAYWGLRSLGIL